MTEELSLDYKQVAIKGILMSLPPWQNGNMNKEPITLNGLNKLKDELVF